MTGSTRCQNQMVNLLQILGLCFETAQTNHGFVCHQSRSIVQGLLYTLWLIEHLHCIIVIDAWRKLNLDFLFLHSFKDARLDWIIECQLHDLSVLDIIISFSVVLKHSGVGCYDLEVMSLLLFLFLNSYLNCRLKWDNLSIFWGSKCIWYSNDHGSRVFENIHVVWLEYRYEHKRVGTF